MTAASAPTCVAAKTCSEIMMKVASTRDEREAAFRLVYRAYRRTELCEGTPAELRFTPYQLLPTTDIYIAQLRDEVIHTMSLVHDGELGLPMEELYPDEVNQRRSDGLIMAEVSCLADRRANEERGFDLFCDVGRLMVQHARQQWLDELLVVVHPRHAPFYRRYLGFRIIGEKRSYSTVNGHPAVPLGLDLHRVRHNTPQVWIKFFGELIPNEALQGHPIPEADCQYFRNLLAAADEAPALGKPRAGAKQNLVGAK